MVLKMLIILNLEMIRNSTYQINLFSKTKMKTFSSPIYLPATFLFLFIYLEMLEMNLGG